jgi:hypothetical protein
MFLKVVKAVYVTISLKGINLYYRDYSSGILIPISLFLIRPYRVHRESELSSAILFYMVYVRHSLV